MYTRRRVTPRRSWSDREAASYLGADEPWKNNEAREVICAAKDIVRGEGGQRTAQGLANAPEQLGLNSEGDQQRQRAAVGRWPPCSQQSKQARARSAWLAHPRSGPARRRPRSPGGLRGGHPPQHAPVGNQHRARGGDTRRVSGFKGQKDHSQQPAQPTILGSAAIAACAGPTGDASSRRSTPEWPGPAARPRSRPRPRRAGSASRQ